MTLWTWARRRRFPRLPAPESRLFDTAPGVRVLAHCHWQADRRAHPALIALHGLEGSSEAHYILGITEKAFAAGFNVVRLNQRNCGGTEHLSNTLYHSGLTEDPVAVIHELIGSDGIDRLVVAGYSLGGNLALKLAGDFGEPPRRELRAVCAVSPVLDLAACVRALERPGERALPVELRAESQVADAAQGALLSGSLSARTAVAHPHRQAVRRGVYRASLRLRRRYRLLLSCQRPACRGPDPHPGAGSDGGRRSLSFRRNRSTIPRLRATRTSPCASLSTVATAPSSERLRMVMTGTGRNG